MDSRSSHNRYSSLAYFDDKSMKWVSGTDTRDQNIVKLSKEDENLRKKWKPDPLDQYKVWIEADGKKHKDDVQFNTPTNWSLIKNDNNVILEYWHPAQDGKTESRSSLKPVQFSKESFIISLYMYDYRTGILYVGSKKRKFQLLFRSKYYNKKFQVQTDDEIVNIARSLIPAVKNPLN